MAFSRNASDLPLSSIAILEERTPACPQVRSTGRGLRLGLILALFSFVGFESAKTLGAEAHEPLKTIPRALIQSALLGWGYFHTVRLHRGAWLALRRRPVLADG